MYHFIGIKGSGMASLAHILLDLGNEVSGSDIEKFIFTQVGLENRGVKITPFSKNNIKDHSIAIVGNSFDETHEEVQAALQNKTVTVYRYTQYLAKLLSDYEGISVTGTHGKTTTTGMVSHVLEPLKRGFLIGDGTGMIEKDAKFFVAESCEYQDNFLNYHPNYAIVLNMEIDHVDYFKSVEQYNDSFQRFINQVKIGVALNGDEDAIRDLSTSNKKLYFGFREDNDVIAYNLSENETNTLFDVNYLGQDLGTFEIELVGKHFVYDALGCISVLLLANIDVELIRAQLKTFKGTKRRFNVEKEGNYVYIDDYAHHPTEIKMTLHAARVAYPNHKQIAIFKPDRPSRITYFKEGFKEALALADVSYVADFPNNVEFEKEDLNGNEFATYCNATFIPAEDEANAEMVAANGEAVYIFLSSKDIYKFKDIIKGVHKLWN